MDVAGGLLIRVGADAGWVREVEIRLRRPQAAALLVGRPAAEAANLVPALYSLCGRAQGVAAQAALAAANGRAADQGWAHQRGRWILAEAVQEHLWRLLLDWPEAMGLPPERELFATWHKRLVALRPEADWAPVAAELGAMLSQHLLGGGPAIWRGARQLTHIPGQGLCAEVLRRLAGGAFRCPASASPQLLPQASADEGIGELASLLAPQPIWQGAPAETGALAAQAGHPLVGLLLAQGERIAARYLARVLALLACADALRGTRSAPPVSAAGTGPGAGLARVETARGALLHWVALEQGRIRDYRVTAPTEWNFHPVGALAAELAGLRRGAAPELAVRAQAAVLSLDPCVPWQLEMVEDA